MDINRNQVFLAGLVLLLFGVQLRAMDAVVLTPKATKFLAEQTDQPITSIVKPIDSVTGKEVPIPGHTVRPPDWIGYFCLSVGAVLILHSWTMVKPAG
jgi:hypothetical protein